MTSVPYVPCILCMPRVPCVYSAYSVHPVYPACPVSCAYPVYHVVAAGKNLANNQMGNTEVDKNTIRQNLRLNVAC